MAATCRYEPYSFHVLSKSLTTDVLATSLVSRNIPTCGDEPHRLCTLMALTDWTLTGTLVSNDHLQGFLGFGFRVSGFGLRVEGLGFRVFGVSGFGFRI